METVTAIRGVLKTAALSILLAVSLVASAHDLLTDRHGMTLYTFDNDVAGSGSSVCSWQCIRIWPPVQAGDELAPGFGAVTREGGDRQLTYHGKPLYYFVGDRRPGDANGDGIDRAWHVVTLLNLSARQYSDQR